MILIKLNIKLKYKTESDCGCVVINAEVLNERFENDDTDLVNTLKKGCERKKRTIKDKANGKTVIDVPHCYEPGHVTVIHSGDEVSCARKKDTA